MRSEIFINSNYSHLKDFVDQIPENFNCLGDVVHAGRNEIRIVTVNGTSLVIKYFKRIASVNRFVYAYIRKSKARRSYEHSLHLLNNGITSPEPIAYINCYKNGLLYMSYYVCLYTNYKPLEELLKLPVTESEEALKAFARFSLRLHKSGIFHYDYNVSNVLFRFSENEYDFSLIDNNRMRFRKYKYSRGIKNMNRLKIPVDCIGIIASEYAKEANTSDIKTLNAMTLVRLIYMERETAKKRIQSLKKLILGKR